jgi:hypothetical protein
MIERPIAARAPPAIAAHSTAEAELSTARSGTLPTSFLDATTIAHLMPKQSEKDDDGDWNPKQPEQD